MTTGNGHGRLIGYEDILAMAKDNGVTVRQLLALDPSNDPFYVGRPATRAQAAWFVELWGRLDCRPGSHLRRIHYQLVSTPGIVRADGGPYENTDRCWDYLCKASKYARTLGLVNVHALEDHRNPAPHAWAELDPTAPQRVGLEGEPFEAPSVGLYAPSLTFPHPILVETETGTHDGYHLEVWIEKSTMNDVILPLCQEFRANLVTSLGFQSITSAVDLLQRIAHRGKPARVFYVSDFDPAGDRMPTATSRQIEFWRQELQLDIDIKVEHLALTADQVRGYDLPRIPIKKSDRRKDGFEARSGEGAVELDALEALLPGVLGALVRERLEVYRDPAHTNALTVALAENQDLIEQQWQATTREERARFDQVAARVDQIVAGYQERVTDLREQMSHELAPHQTELQELWQATADRFDDFMPEVRALPMHPEVEEPWHWLLDTDRDYIDQIVAYRRDTRDTSSTDSPQPKRDHQ